MYACVRVVECVGGGGVHVCVDGCVWVCVSERERERGGESVCMCAGMCVQGRDVHEMHLWLRSTDY